MRALRLSLICAVILIAFTSMASAFLKQEATPVYEPEEGRVDLKQYTCASFLRITEADEGRQAVHVVWAHGYFSGRHGIDLEQPLTSETLEKFNERLLTTCKATPSKLFIRAVEEME